MITSIFSKSKPFNIVIVGLVVTVVFVVSNVDQIFQSVTAFSYAFVKLLIVVFLVFLLNFIVSKNKLVQGNSYHLMTFGLLFLLLPNAMWHADLIVSNLFVMFAIRRLISLQSNLHTKKKFFDAGFWIAFATFFYFWSFLFFALVLVALIYHSQNDIKNLIIPFVGSAAFFILMLGYNIIVHDVYLLPSNFERFASLDFTPYNSLQYILKLTTLFSAFIWALVYYFNGLKDKNKQVRPSYFLLAWASILAIFVALIAPIKNGGEFVFLFAPMAIIMANYLEGVSDRWFKEVFPILFLLVPLVCLAL